MTVLTLHAKDRAWERYGVALTDDDGAALIALCKSGRAPCMRKDHMGRIHVGALNGTIFVFALHPDEDRITTFLPRDYFNRASRLEHRREEGRIHKSTPRAAKYARNPTYSRAQMQREGRQMEDEE